TTCTKRLMINVVFMAISFSIQPDRSFDPFRCSMAPLKPCDVSVVLRRTAVLHRQIANRQRVTVRYKVAAFSE
ncbi:MAG: hypothetical protein QMB52_00380, partial [Propionivibrio sp.]